jgi:iduronate 2-sulfatase
MKTSILVTLIVLLCSFGADSKAKEYDVFIIGGQSNMDGRGKVSDLPPELAKPQEKIKFYFRNPLLSTSDWIALSPGYSVAPNYKEKTLPSGTFGPEINFGAQLAKALPAKNLALIKATKGGTSLKNDWKPGTKNQPKTHGPLYKNFLGAIEDSLALLKKNGDTYTIKGMIWHQGESDAALTAEEYERLLTEFIARVREDLKLPNMPFVIGEVFDNGKRDSIRTAQLAVSKAVPGVGFFSVKDLKTSDNGTHFDSAGQLIMGERFAAEMVKLLPAK